MFQLVLFIKMDIFGFFSHFFPDFFPVSLSGPFPSLDALQASTFPYIEAADGNNQVEHEAGTMLLAVKVFWAHQQMMSIPTFPISIPAH